MRIVTLFLKYSIALAIFLLVVGVIVREGLLFWGTAQLKDALRTTEITGRVDEEYDRQCRQIGGGKSGGGLERVQLRFLDDTHYVVEVICQFFTNAPITVGEYTLPMFVKKYPGSSGFIWDSTQKNAVTLEVYMRRNTVMLEQGKISLVQGVLNTDEPIAMPVTVCSGYGFQCCSTETQIGEDGQQPQASDCPEQCFQTCTSRPTILKLTSDPLPSTDTRTVRLGKGMPITYYYVTDSGQASSATTTLTLGDGQTQSFTDLEGSYTHQYQCDQPQCTYKVELTAVDATGIGSVSTAISVMTVVVE
jgi:hypothetical protein